MTPPCPTELLTITVIDPTDTTNVPVANTDQSSTPEATTVVIDVTGNDAPGNPNGSLGNPTVTDPPSNGVAIVNADGTVSYTPNPGFIGTDTFTYEICDTTVDPEVCTEAIAIIDVLPSGQNGLTTADDYNTTPMNTPVSDNALDNDTDPNGDPMTVTAVTTPTQVPGGTYTIDDQGNYTFTPDSGFTGTAEIPYQVCDSQGLCEWATIYIVVPPNGTYFPDINTTLVDAPISGDVSTNDQAPSGTTYSNPVPNPNNPSTEVPVLNPDGTYTFTSSTPGVYNFEVEVCAPEMTPPCPTELLTITVLDSMSTDNDPAVNTDIAAVDSGSTTGVAIDVKANDQVSYLGGSLGDPTVTTQPNNGTTVVNPDGTIQYIPNPGFEGRDTFYYEVCDTAMTPEKCDTAMVIVIVDPVDENNITAADDYVLIEDGQQASGNALDNDVDPENDPLSVTPKTDSVPGVGVFTIDASGNYTFTPSGGFVGPVNFVYEVCDTAGNCTEATIYIIVGEVQTAPTYIQLVDYTVTVENCTAVIRWTTESEVNSDKAVIERADGVGADFQIIGMRTLAGNSNAPIDYDFVDNTLASGQQEYIYRIKFVDKNMSFQYTDAQSINYNCGTNNSELIVTNNPVPGDFQLVFKGFAKDTRMNVVVVNALGQQIVQKYVEIDANRVHSDLDLTDYASGYYHIIILDETTHENYNLKLIKR